MLSKFVIFMVLVYVHSQICPQAQYFQFYVKQCLNPYPFIKNPYQNPTPQYISKVNQNLNNKNRVCSLKYQSLDKKTYLLKNFESRTEAEQNGWIVTHQGRCGGCSSTRDLFVYLTTDLTRPVRKCGVKFFYSHKDLWKCIKRLGFTDQCTQVWFWNTINTKKQCGLVCMWSLLAQRPFVINGNLNKCLQCDQDQSGPIFKYESGRTRRNSGIKSEIDRPIDQIYNITHCYY